jgi:hypothetical protein
MRRHGRGSSSCASICPKSLHATTHCLHADRRSDGMHVFEPGLKLRSHRQPSLTVQAMHALIVSGKRGNGGPYLALSADCAPGTRNCSRALAARRLGTCSGCRARAMRSVAVRTHSARSNAGQRLSKPGSDVVAPGKEKGRGGAPIERAGLSRFLSLRGLVGIEPVHVSAVRAIATFRSLKVIARCFFSPAGG